MTTGEVTDIEKLVDQEALANFNASEFVSQMRGFITDHPEVVEKVVVYVNDKMRDDILAQMTDAEKTSIQLVALADLVTRPEHGHEAGTSV